MYIQLYKRTKKLFFAPVIGTPMVYLDTRQLNSSFSPPTQAAGLDKYKTSGKKSKMLFLYSSYFFLLNCQCLNICSSKYFNIFLNFKNEYYAMQIYLANNRPFWQDQTTMLDGGFLDIDISLLF